MFVPDLLRSLPEEVAVIRGPIPAGTSTLFDLIPKIRAEEMKGRIWELCVTVIRLHSLGWIHRSLHPRNIYLINDRLQLGRVSGMNSRMIESPAKYEPNTYEEEYRAPEHFTGGGPAVETSDIWALGVILYQMMTQTLPFSAQKFGHLYGDIYVQVIAPKLWAPNEQYATHLRQHPYDTLARNVNRFSTCPGYNPLLVELILLMLCPFPERRIRGLDLLQHEYFQGIPSPQIRLLSEMEMLNRGSKPRAEPALRVEDRSLILDRLQQLWNRGSRFDERNYFLAIELLDDLLPEDQPSAEKLIALTTRYHRSKGWESYTPEVLTKYGLNHWIEKLEFHRTLIYDYAIHLNPSISRELLWQVMADLRCRSIPPQRLALQLSQLDVSYSLSPAQLTHFFQLTSELTPLLLPPPDDPTGEVWTLSPHHLIILFLVLFILWLFISP